MGYIYKITNKVNNKIYIGKTVTSEPIRWQQHIWYANNAPKKDCPYLCNAIKKYGKESFDREILEEIEDSKLSEREIYWIKFFDSNNKERGYNLSKGGDGSCKFNDEEILEVYSKTNNINETARILGASRDGIAKRLHGLNIDTYDTRVCQYDLQGNLINIYNSFTEATTLLGKTKSTIPSSRYYLGYFWKRINDNKEINFNNLLIPQLQTIEQYDTNCNLIKIFSNATEASKELKINVSSIKACLNGKQVTAGGYIWHRSCGKLSLKEQYQKYIKSSSCCEIEEIDKEGNIIKKYKSCSFAEKELGWSYNSIKKVCDGKQKQTHNRIFRYSNPDKRKLLNEKVG